MRGRHRDDPIGAAREITCRAAGVPRSSVDVDGRLGGHDAAVAVGDDDGRLVLALKQLTDRRDVLGHRSISDGRRAVARAALVLTRSRGVPAASVSGRRVELIIARNLISSLELAAFIVDDEGVVRFFNDSAGQLLGQRFEDAGPLPREEWSARFGPFDGDGAPLPAEDVPTASTT